MRMNLVRSLMVVALLLAAGVGRVAAQGAPAAGGTPPPPSKFKVMSPAYPEGSQIPTQYTCAATPPGANPVFTFSDAPAATVSLAVIFHDLDGAPAKGSMDVTHWIFWNIPPTMTTIPANVAVDATTGGIAQGKNVRNVNGYQPPCPPVGATPHHYLLELYALDSKLDLAAGSARADLLKAMDGHVIGKTAYYGIYGR